MSVVDNGIAVGGGYSLVSSRRGYPAPPAKWHTYTFESDRVGFEYWSFHRVTWASHLTPLSSRLINGIYVPTAEGFRLLSSKG